MTQSRFDKLVPIGCTGVFFCLMWLWADAAVPVTMLVLLGCGLIRDMHRART